MKNSVLSLILLMGLSIIWTGCNISSHSNPQSGLELNQGKKWKINPEMMVFLNQSEEEIRKLENPSNQDLINLSQTLDKLNGELTSSCTMTGEAHDQLHLWLHPYMEQVEALEDKPTTENYQAIVRSFDTFHEFFE